MWYNGLMIAILRSPLHGLISKSFMLITYTGRKSGKAYTLPVNYMPMRDERGEYLATVSLQERTWWRSLRGGAKVTVRFQGKDTPASAEAIVDAQAVGDYLGAYLRQYPQYARYMNVSLDENGQPETEALARAAIGRVFIRTYLG